MAQVVDKSIRVVNTLPDTCKAGNVCVLVDRATPANGKFYVAFEDNIWSELAVAAITSLAATAITFDHTGTDLVATNVQTALVELENRVAALEP